MCKEDIQTISTFVNASLKIYAEMVDILTTLYNGVQVKSNMPEITAYDAVQLTATEIRLKLEKDSSILAMFYDILLLRILSSCGSVEIVLTAIQILKTYYTFRVHNLTIERTMLALAYEDKHILDASYVIARKESGHTNVTSDLPPYPFAVEVLTKCLNTWHGEDPLELKTGCKVALASYKSIQNTDNMQQIH